MTLTETKTVDTAAGPSTVTPRMRFQLDDHIWSARLECDDVGMVISYEEFHPYGTSAYRSARSGVEVSERRYRYTGKERDDETGFQIHGLRYYVPWLGRWTTSDPIGLEGGLNGFGYCRGDPVGKVDPSGTDAGAAQGHLEESQRQAAQRQTETKWGYPVELHMEDRKTPAAAQEDPGSMMLEAGPTPEGRRAQYTPETEALLQGGVESVTSQIPASLTDYGASIAGPFNPMAPVNMARGLAQAADTVVNGNSVERSRLGGFILGNAALAAVAGRLFGGPPGAKPLEAPPTSAKPPPKAPSGGGGGGPGGGGGGGGPGRTYRDPSEIRFTQDSIKQSFKDGGNINDTISQLSGPRGAEIAESIPPIRIFEKNGATYSLDNRRLAAFSAAQTRSGGAGNRSRDRERRLEVHDNPCTGHGTKHHGQGTLRSNDGTS